MKKFNLAAFMCAFLCFPFFAQAQQSHEVKGTVTDSGGEAIIGAAVMIKGTGSGTTTGVDGSTVIQVAVDGRWTSSNTDKRAIGMSTAPTTTLTPGTLPCSVNAAAPCT